MSDSVMAIFEFRGDPLDLARRYDDVLRRVVAVSSGRPIMHVASPRDDGFMVIDVWNSTTAFSVFEGNEDFRRVLREVGLPEPTIRTYPVHNLGWPVDAVPLYR